MLSKSAECSPVGFIPCAGQRDVRMEGACLRCESRLRGGVLHLLIERGELRAERYAGKDDSRALEHIKPIDLNGDGWGLNSAEPG